MGGPLGFLLRCRAQGGSHVDLDFVILTVIGIITVVVALILVFVVL